MGRRPNWEYDSAYYRNRVRQIHQLHPDWTDIEIANYLQISNATVGNYLKRVRRQDCA